MDMAFIEWSQAYETGIPEIDDQHRHLVEIVNTFEGAVRKNKATRITQEILRDLIGYTQEHFAFEEKCMAEAGYPGLQRHRALHRQLMQKVERFQYEFGTEGRWISRNLQEFLRYWLLSHIQTEDMAFARETRGAGTAAGVASGASGASGCPAPGN